MALLLAACSGPTGGASLQPGSSETTSAPATATTEATEADLVVALQGPSRRLEVVSLSGAVVGHVQPRDADGVIGVTPHDIFEVTGTRLLLYGVSGNLIATEPFSAQNLSSQPVFNASGSEWVWSTSTTHDLNNTSTPTETAIFEGTMAQPMRQLATHLDPLGERLAPLAIVGNTVYLAERGSGAALIPGAWTLDLASKKLSLLWPQCGLEDVGADDALLCLQASATAAGSASPIVQHRDGSTVTLQLPSSASYPNGCGTGELSPDGTRFVQAGVGAICGYAPTVLGPTSGGRGAVLSTDLGNNVSSVSGATFLPDGRLLMTTITAASASPTCSVRALDGTMTTIRLPAGASLEYVIDDPASN